VDARGASAWRVVGGIPLAARTVRQLEGLGVRRVLVATEAARPAADAGARRAETRLEVVALEPGAPLAEAVPDELAGAQAVVADATLVTDSRLLARLVEASDPVVVEPVPPRPGRALRLGRVDARQLRAAHEAGRPDPGLARLDPASLSEWTLQMRGRQAILLEDATDPTAARRVESDLLRRTQKAVMDLPALLVDPVVEDAIVSRLAPTRITPNQITVLALALGLGAAWLALEGRFLLALPLMLLVGWLDGVDGKLARLRLHYSKLGAGESYFDFAYENAWWIALTVWFAQGEGGAVAGWLGAAWVAGNLLDEVAYTLADPWLGRSLDLLTPWDGAFRLVAGRRNIYVYILIAGALLGSLWGAFVVCALWAVLTGLAHAARLALAVRGVGVRPVPA
jgi:phosphatidylglycerophosphate synthase